jgi:hypothetical protein
LSLKLVQAGACRLALSMCALALGLAPRERSSSLSDGSTIVRRGRLAGESGMGAK